jgi:hypothetical protein
MKGDEVVEGGEKRGDSALLVIARKSHFASNRVFRRYLHIVLSAFVHKGMKIVVESGVLIEIALHEIWIYS